MKLKQLMSRRRLTFFLTLSAILALLSPVYPNPVIAAQTSECVIGSSEACPATSPQEIYNLYGTTSDGTYWIRINGTATQVYLKMNRSGSDNGAWVLLMKGARGTSNFGYSSTYFSSNSSTLNTGSLADDVSTDAKFSAYNNLPIVKLLAVLKNPSAGTVTANGDIPNNGFGGHVWLETFSESNAYTKLNTSTRLNNPANDVWTSVPKTKYYTSSSGSQVFSYQDGYGRYGFNGAPCTNSSFSYRWGIAWNQEADWGSCDVVVGIGLGGFAPGDQVAWTGVTTGSVTSNTGHGNMGFQIWGKVSDPSLAAPSGLTVSNTASGQVSLAWTAPSGIAITDYVVQYKTAAASTYSNSFIVSGQTNASISGLSNATSYNFRVIARTSSNSTSSANYSSSTVSHTISAYSIFYDGNGNNSGSAPGTQTKIANVNLVLATNIGSLARTGYTFGGWNTASNGTGTDYAAGATYSGNAPLTLYAKWISDTYSVTYSANNATSGSPPVNQLKIYNESLSLATNSGSLTRTGYVFSGWNTEINGNGVDYPVGSTYTGNAPLSLFAKWILETFTVTYDGNGATAGTVPSSQTRVFNSLLSVASNSGSLELPGYLFTGWNTAANGQGVHYEEGANFTEDASITLYAQWSANTLSITYDARSGTIPSGGSASTTTGSTISSLPTTTRTGYTFLGWFTAATSGTQITTTAAHNQTESFTLYAQWSANSNTVTFNTQGGSVVASQSWTTATSLPLPTAPTKAGYTFLGWFDTTTSGTKLGDASTSYTPSNTDSFTLYAQWLANTLSIIYDANSGTTPSGGSASTTTGSTISSLPTTSRPGYTFQGWFTATTGGTQITTSAAHNQTSSFTLYAQWSANTNTVTFKSNYVGGAADSTQSITTDVATNLAANTLTRAGYTFVGWNTEANGGGNSYSNRQSVTIDSALTLFAQWSANTNSIIYDNQGATTSQSGGSTSYVTDSSITTIPTTSPQKVGNNFAGWFTAPSGGVQVTDGSYIPSSPFGTITLYAQWIAHTVPGAPVIGSASASSATSATVAFTAPASTGGVVIDSYTATSSTGGRTGNLLQSGSGTITIDGLTPDTVYTFTVTANNYVGSSSPSSVSNSIRTATIAPTIESVSVVNTTITVAASLSSGEKNTWFYQIEVLSGSGCIDPDGVNATTNTSGAPSTFQIAGITRDCTYTLRLANWNGTTSEYDSVTVWTGNVYSVTYDSNSATSGSTPGSQRFNHGTSVTLQNNSGLLARTGYTFSGWNTAATGSGTTYDEADLYSINSDVTLFALWDANTLAITYDARGGSTPSGGSTSTKTGQSISALATSIRAGYTLMGWFTQASGGNEIQTTSAHGKTSNFTLYAQWSANTLTVTFDSQGGSAIPSTTTQTADVIASNPGSPTRTGYDFAGWFASSSGGSALSFPYTHNQTDSFTVYAQWIIKQYTVTYDSNSATSGNVPSPQTSDYNSAVSVASNSGTLIRPGYTFQRWNTQADGGGIDYAATGSAPITLGASDVTLYAVWSANTNTVTFNSQGGSSVASQSWNTATSLPLPAAPTKAGYTFLGWFDTTTSGTKLGDASSSYTPSNTDSFTVYAQWSANTNTVTFNSQGGSAVASQSWTTATSLPLPAAPTRAGYTFLGWFDTTTSGTKLGDASTSYTPSNTDSFTVFAQWSANQNRVIFNTHGGSSVPSVDWTTATQLTLPSAPSRAGYTFLAWFDTQTSGTRLGLGGESYSPLNTDTFTIHAQWSANKNRVNFDAQGGSETASLDWTTATQLTLPAAPVRVGYTFLGWFDTTVAGVKLGDSASVITPLNTETFTAYAQWNINTYTITYDAGRNGTSPRTSDAFQVVDADLQLPLPVRQNFTFEGWFDASTGGNRIGGAGASLRPLESKTLFARWTQTSLYGVAPEALTELGEVRANNVARTSLSAEVESSAISVSVPAGALPAGTVVKAQLVGDFSRASTLITTPGNFIFSMVVSWLAPDETVPDTAANKPLSLTITNPAIKAGSSIYSLLGSEVTFLGRATQNGTVTVQLRTDPEIVIVAKVPDSPTAVTATNGENGKSVVSWTAPAIDGGSQITGYTVTSSDGQTCITSGELSCSFIGLTNGSQYSFRVVATNAIGDSILSETSNVVTPSAPAPIMSGGPSPIPVPTTPNAPVKDSTGANLSSSLGESRVIMNGSPVSANVQIVDQAIVQVISGPIAVNVRALTEARDIKRLEENSVLNFISREYARVGGDGFKPQTTVRVWLLSTPRLLGEVVTDVNGRFDANLLFTADIPIGAHTIQITGVSRENALTAVAVGIQVSERILQKIESVTATVVESNLNLQWSGNAVATKITFQPSRGKTIIYLVEGSGRDFSVPEVRPGYAYQIRLEPLFDPATDSAKSISVVLPPLAPRDLKFSLLSSDALQVKWVGDIGSIQYRVVLLQEGKEVSTQVTAEPTALVTINPEVNQQIRVIAIGDGDTFTAASQVIEYQAPKAPEKPKPRPTKPEKVPAKKPAATIGSTTSLRAYLVLSGRLVPSEIRTKLATIANGLKTGDSVRCTAYVPSPAFNQGIVSRSLRKTVAICDAVKKLSRKSKVFASVTRTTLNSQYPRSGKYLFEVVASKREEDGKASVTK